MRIFISVDLPAPFSPSRARTEPPVATRSTPWRTSTPLNDFVMPATSTTARSASAADLSSSKGSAGELVIVTDRLARHRHERNEQVLGDFFAVDRLDHVRDPDPA